MSSQDISLALEERTVIRKGLKQLHKDGKVPAVIHDHGKQSIHVMADYVPINKVYAQAGKHHPVQLTVGSAKHLALIKDADFEPVKHRLRHVVFQAIKQNEKVSAEIPVVLTGDEIPAEKVSLIVLTQLDTVEVEAFPRDLPDQLEVDATVLAEVGDRLTVADIKALQGVTILTDPEHVIAMVEMPKDQIAEANAAAESLAADAAASGDAVEQPAAEEPKAEGETEEKA
jgi:large subunit ribosomal protein L25